MVTIQVEVDSRKLVCSALLLPVKDVWLASTTCRQLLHHVLDGNFPDRKDALAQAEFVALYCVK